MNTTLLPHVLPHVKPNRLVNLVLALLLTGLTAGFWFNFQDSYFGGLVLNDAMDYAGIARNITEGQGITSQYSTPLSLVYSSIPQPDMWRAPGWPLFLALFQAALGSTDEASAWAGGICFILAAPLIFLLALSLFGQRLAGMLTGLLAWLFYLFSPQFLDYSISGMTESVSILLMLPLMVLLFSHSGFNWPISLLIGLVLGFFYLTRYNAILFLPFVLALRFWQCPKNGRFKAVLLVLAGLLLVVSPWMISNICL
ncbi:MAG: glycosyltransferase family 39 protein, partial [Clostridia bacterium]|nr:glycosyltransferase family 39 protein [Clostridia bacterium]